MSDISGTNTIFTCIASVSFPAGFPLTEAADDVDMIDIPSLQITEGAMGPNGDLVTWSRANPIKITVGVVPGGETDNNLQILFENNRVSRNQSVAGDVITLNAIFPDGSRISLNNGKLTDGMPGFSVTSAGRKKSMVYGFIFESIQRNRT